MTMYYTEVDGAEPTVSIQVKEIKYTFTQESLVNMIEQKDSFKEMLELCQRSKRSMAGDVKAFFEEVYTDNETDMLVSVDDVNELLVSIGADPFSKSWSATITITATVTGVEASSKDEVENNEFGDKSDRKINGANGMHFYFRTLIIRNVDP